MSNGETGILDATGQTISYKSIEPSYPLNQHAVGERFRSKGHDWVIADVRGQWGMIVVSATPARTEEFWTVNELFPLKGYWYRVAVVGREGFVLAPKQPCGKQPDVA